MFFSEPLSPPVVLDVISWPELSERFGSLPLDANTSGWIRQILGANVKQIYRTVHKSVLPLNTHVILSAVAMSYGVLYVQYSSCITKVSTYWNRAIPMHGDMKVTSKVGFSRLKEHIG